VREAAAAPIQVAQQRGSRTSRAHRAAPAARNSYGYYGAYGGQGVEDWSHWSPSYHPGWPCVSGTPSETSAYPAWEVRPQCQ
jgi:hypothetical protein